MKIANLVLILLMLFLSLNASFALTTASTIHGSIYDLDLEKVNNSIIEINTNPPQLIVSKEGNYSIELNSGEYILSARHKDFGSIKRKITVIKEGIYYLDLILFPSIELEKEFFNETDLEINYEELEPEKSYFLQYLIGGLMIAVFIVLIYLKLAKKESLIQKIQPSKDFENDFEKVLNEIKNEGGRITQKSLRKKLPYSEAKISLIIKDLQAKGKIEKIKQGNKNIIVGR